MLHGQMSPNPWDFLYFVNLDSVSNFSFLGCLEVKKTDGLRVGCAGYVVGGLRRLCGGFMHIIMLRCGSILQAGTCQILSLAENTRWSRVWQYQGSSVQNFSPIGALADILI